MEIYKTGYYNPETFERTEIETNLPTDLVKAIRNCLDGNDNYLTTPTMINPEDNSVAVGVMDLNDRSLKYNIILKNI